MSHPVNYSAALQPEGRLSSQIREMAEVLLLICALVGGLMALMAIHHPALAQEAEESPEPVPVSYVHQDLTDPARARRLLVRIDRAALKACGDMNGLSIPTQELIKHSDCHHESFARTVAALHSPTLSQQANALDPWVGPKS